jgi:hypothetical protein
MAAMFWLSGYSSYVFTTTGQDGLPGEYCMHRFLADAKSVLHALIVELNPSRVILFGSCAGGAIAGHLAIETERPTTVVLWEAPAHYTEADVQKFMERSGLPLAKNFVDTVVHLDTALPQIKCPVLIAYGPPVTPEKAAYRHDDIRTTEFGLQLLRPHQIERCFIPETDHNLTRGSNPQALRDLIAAADSFSERHSGNISKKGTS